MAGNLVKWWKHKILGGYKQFSVQECATDSEELIYNQVRASSSCSAPPDLLLVSDRENNIPLRSEIAPGINTLATPNNCPAVSSSNNNPKDPQQHHPPQQHLQKQSSASYNNYKEANVKHQTKITSSRQCAATAEYVQQQQLDNEGQLDTQQNNSSARHAHRHQPRPDEHIRLEEFTCDVSVEGGKSSQPLQFSFTFYDLDGHHGKITKDDIVGIVYTIYESIGKSVVVPHSGSKTINVRLTVSPDDKTSKSSKVTKKVAPSSFTFEQQNIASQKDTNNAPARRLHRYRPRKIIKSDEEDDDSNSDKEREIPTTQINTSANILLPSKNGRVSSKPPKGEQPCCLVPPEGVQTANPDDSIYDQLKKDPPILDTCRECETQNVAIYPIHNKSAENEAYLKNVTSTRIKLHRKSRKQKYHQECMQTRQRSLSVGNETCWNNRHLQKAANQNHQLPWMAAQQLHTTDVLDGVQLRNPFQPMDVNVSQKRNSAECWKTALNRNDLISIIRESMEKNRLCFQLNGKPQANVSPIRQQSQRQHPLQTMKQSQSQTRQKTKIPMLIAKHNNRSTSFSNNNDLIGSELQQNSNSIYHLQPNGPVFQQHMGLNAAALTAHNAVPMHNGSGVSSGQHSKMNLCGYDSFLHATICGGRLNPASPTQTPLANAPLTFHHTQPQQQPIATATVQPMVSTFNSNPPCVPKQMGLSQGPNNSSKPSSRVVRNGSLSQIHTHGGFSSPNSPQYHGYQRLPSGIKNGILHLNMSEQGPDKLQLQNECSEKFRSNQIQNYDLYAKLTEKLQRTSLAASNKENAHRRYKHRGMHHRRINAGSATVHENEMCPQAADVSAKSNEYTTLMPFCEDVEFQNLIGQTSDDDSHSQHEIVAHETNENENIAGVPSSSTRHVAEGTLVDLEDLDVPSSAINVGENSNSNNILVASPKEDSESHIEDEVEIDDELDDDLADLDEIAANESDRNSPISNEANEATIVHTNGANTSTTSSLIHRYVHEHIHHHYHHFEEKDE
uniref:Protein naked cuticle homolog n=1 Tax=Stomoxys calcitrans TaxID=35570 RepID=A0A1I8NX69_STOCA